MQRFNHMSSSTGFRQANNKQAGFTMVEMMISIMVFLVVAMALLQHMTQRYSSTMNHRQRVFAYAKAQAILAEMHALVGGSDDTAAIDLDTYDDGALYVATLSINEEAGSLVPPEHPISDNTTRNGAWEWYRQIKVRPFAGLNNRSMRYVTVSVFRRTRDGQQVEHASLSSVINSVGSAFPTTQVFDVYLLALENIPGWWVYMENIVPSVEAAITDLETRNPGLAIRTHWITKSSYGRNQLYKPASNNAVDSNQQQDSVYYYPGRMPTGNSSSYYYVPLLMNSRIQLDGAEINGYDATYNPFPYAMADFYNHGMRLPQERDWHDQRVAAIEARELAIQTAILGGTPEPDPMWDMSKEPTLRLLLEDMNTDPDKFRHALLINLHGELVPFPSIRNYSDPAKDPLLTNRYADWTGSTLTPDATWPTTSGMRVVTHPEELRTHRDPAAVTTDDVNLRVYAYHADPSTYTGNGLAPWVLLKVMDVNLTDGFDGFGAPKLVAGGKICAMPGGVDIGVPLTPVEDYPAISMTNPAYPMARNYFDNSGTPNPKGMRWYASFQNPGVGLRKYTLIYLINTPVVATANEDDATPGNWRGLFNDQQSRLYGLEYNPAPTRDTNFDRDLSALGTGPKNSARWRITIPAAVMSQNRFYQFDGGVGDYVAYTPTGDEVLTVQTGFYDPANFANTGHTFPAMKGPNNLSETYTWWASSRTAVPATERSQFLGDPRFNPYKDLLSGDPDFPDGYNWCFDELTPSLKGVGNDFPGLVYAMDRYNGQIRQDAPRYFQLLRDAVVNCEAIYTTLTGYSYYYMGFGNEIGYDSSNGYPSSIPTDLKPFGSPGSIGNVNNITGYRRYVREGGGGGSFWWGMPWLGELYPDRSYLDFAVNGNLLSGTGAAEFYRYQDSLCHDDSTKYQAFNTRFESAKQRSQEKGSVSFMNNGTPSSHFNHNFSSGTATLVAEGLDLGANYNFPLPSGIDSNRPFDLNTGSNDGPEWGLLPAATNPYMLNRYNATLTAEYYERGSKVGSGLVQLENPAGTSAGHIVVSGLSPSTTLGSSFISKFSVLAMLQSFFEMGDTGLTHRIKQPPRVEIESPTDVTELISGNNVTLLWDCAWVRWDGGKYTSGTPNGFAEAETELEYVWCYSTDNAMTWRHMVDNSPATPGVKPTNPAVILADATVGQESYVWPNSSALTQGGYLIRVEAYRQNQSLHYSQHMMRIFINTP